MAAGNIPRHLLKEGLKEACAIVARRKAESDNPVLVLIAGGSGSGKTAVVAKKISEHFPHDTLLLSMDDWYKGKRYMDEQERIHGIAMNYDQPEVFDFALLLKQLSLLKHGFPVEKPVYDFPSAERAGYETVYPKKIIIVEGLYPLHDALLSEEGLRVFVDIGLHGRLIRRLMRDIKRTGQTPNAILNMFLDEVVPMHALYVQPTMKNADMVIDNEYDAATEAVRAGLCEMQMKAGVSFGPDQLREIGAERLTSVAIEDRYFFPHDRDLSASGEAIRIRAEGHGERKTHLFTYKGPHADGERRMRPKFEFEIDAATVAQFASLYGNCVKHLLIERRLYMLCGIVFSMDSVFKKNQSAGAAVKAGDFIEIRMAGCGIGDEPLRTFLRKLGLSQTRLFRESYFDICE